MPGGSLGAGGWVAAGISQVVVTWPQGPVAAAPSGAAAEVAAPLPPSWEAGRARAGGEKRVPSARCDRSVADTYPAAVITGIKARV